MLDCLAKVDDGAVPFMAGLSARGGCHSCGAAWQVSVCGERGFDSEWFARNWHTMVGSGEVKHYRAGTSVQTLGSKRGAFAYAAKKYVAKTGECI